MISGIIFCDFENHGSVGNQSAKIEPNPQQIEKNGEGGRVIRPETDRMSSNKIELSDPMQSPILNHIVFSIYAANPSTIFFS